MEIDYVLLGPMRFFLLGIVFFAIRVLIPSYRPMNHLDYLIKNLAIYGSLVLMMVFLLIQMGVFDLLTLLSLATLAILAKHLRVWELFRGNSYLLQLKRNILVKTMHLFEGTFDVKSYVLYKLTPKRLAHLSIEVYLVLPLIFFVIIIRYLFLRNDLYTLTDNWFENLQLLKNLNPDFWLGGGSGNLGEMALISFYGNITGISEEMALHSAGLLEGAGLILVVYWAVARLTGSDVWAPLISVFSLFIGIQFLPINLDLQVEHNPLYLGITFAIPAIVFTLRPDLLSKNRFLYTTYLTLVYTAVASIHIYISAIIFPVFLLLAFIIGPSGNRPFVGSSITAFLLGTGLVITTYFGASVFYSYSFIDMISANFLAVDAYAHFPQVGLALDDLMTYYSILAGILIIMAFGLIVQDHHRGRLLLTVSLFILWYFMIYWYPWNWLDEDLYIQMVPVFVIIIVGLCAGALIHYLRVFLSRKVYLPLAVAALIFACLMAFANLSNRSGDNYSRADNMLKSEILGIYHRLSTENLPFTYAVVNHRYGQGLSKSEHFFMDYKNFIELYPKRDSIYYERKDQPGFLQDHPELIVPESVFVFLTAPMESPELKLLETPQKHAKNTEVQLRKLASKGRTIRTYYNSENVTVYQIINTKNATKMDEMIWNL